MRIMYFFILPKGLNFGDAQHYYNVAKNFSLGKGMYNDYVEPITNYPLEPYMHNRHIGYVIFLALIFKLFGYNENYIYFAQSILDILICIFIFLISKKIGLSDLFAFLAAIIYAFYPINAVFSFMVLAETLFTFLCIILIFVFVNKKEYDIKKYFIAGLLCGLAVLTRPSFQFYVIFIFLDFILAFIFKNIDFKNLLFSLLAFFSIFFIILFFWMFRNYKLFGKFFLSFGGGWTLYESNNPAADGAPSKSNIPFQEMQKKIPYLEQDRYFTELAIKWIKQEPIKFLKLIPIKFFRFWNVVPNFDKFNKFLFDLLSGIFHIVIYFFFLFALFKKIKFFLFAIGFYLFSFILYFSLLHSIFIGSLRYRAPVMPYVFIIAMIGCEILFNRFKIKRKV